MKLHDRVRSYRVKAELTQAEAAILVGVSLRTFQRWESGDTSISKSDLAVFLAKTGLGPPIIQVTE